MDFQGIRSNSVLFRQALYVFRNTLSIFFLPLYSYEIVWFIHNNGADSPAGSSVLPEQEGGGGYVLGRDSDGERPRQRPVGVGVH